MTRRLELGVSVGAHEFAAGWGDHYWEAALPAGPTSDAIREATVELKRLIGAHSRVSLYVAILPPLVRIRRVALPRMNRNDLRLAIETNAQQYFVGIGDVPVCGAVLPQRTGRRAAFSALAFAANGALVESIAAGLETEGWTIRRIVPGQFAWANAMIRRQPGLSKGSGRLGIRLPGELNVLELESGSLVRVRRHRLTEDEAAHASVRHWCVAGDRSGQTPAVVAAVGAKKTTCCEILPPRMRRARTLRGRTASMILAAFTCATWAGAAIVYRSRLQHQLTDIAARRSAVRSRASIALASRDSIQALSDRTRSILELAESAPRWSAVLSRIVIALPATAEVISIRANSDSLTLDGQSAEASQIVSSLQRTPGVTSTKMMSPVVHEATDGGVTTERWRFALSVDHKAAVGSR